MSSHLFFRTYSGKLDLDDKIFEKNMGAWFYFSGHFTSEITARPILDEKWVKLKENKAKRL